jgi:hypothetical protein
MKASVFVMWVVCGLMVVVGVEELSRGIVGDFHLGRRVVWALLGWEWVRGWMLGGAEEMQRVVGD